jgi:hypothetical protein
VTQQQRQRAIAGFALVVLGLALYYLENLGHSLVLFLVGGGFLVFYFYRREFGLLIPGCIILSLGLGSIGSFAFPDFTQGLALGLGFMAITVVALIYERRFVWWPLIPGAVLVLLNLPRGRELVRTVLDNWQLGLVVVGVIVLVSAFVRPGKRTSGGPGA